MMLNLDGKYNVYVFFYFEVAPTFKQGMRWHGCSGCTNPQIFGTSPFAPADFEASSTMCTRCFETQSSTGWTCTRRSKFLTHSLLRTTWH